MQEYVQYMQLRVYSFGKQKAFLPLPPLPKQGWKWIALSETPINKLLRTSRVLSLGTPGEGARRPGRSRKHANAAGCRRAVLFSRRCPTRSARDCGRGGGSGLRVCACALRRRPECILGRGLGTPAPFTVIYI